MLLLNFATALLCVLGGADAWSTKSNSKGLAARDAHAVKARTYDTGCTDKGKQDACKGKVNHLCPSYFHASDRFGMTILCSSPYWNEEATLAEQLTDTAG